MYQMVSYSIKSGSKNLALIYPRVGVFNKEIKYEIKSPFLEDSIEIKIITINFHINYKDYLEILDLEKLYKNQDSIINNDVLVINLLK